MKATQQQEADSWARRESEALVFCANGDDGEHHVLARMLELLVPWQQRAKGNRRGMATPWYRLVPYLAACGITDSDYKDDEAMRSGRRVLHLGSYRFFEALVTMGLSTARVDTPRDFFLRVKRFIFANVGVLGAQSMYGNEVFEEWEENECVHEDPTLLIDCMPIGELASEVTDGRYHMIHYSTLMILVGQGYRCADRQMGTQFHLAGAALLDAVAGRDCAVKAMQPLMVGALKVFHEAVNAYKALNRANTRNAENAQQVAARQDASAKLEGVRRVTAPAATLVAKWWRESAPEDELFVIEASWPLVLSEISTRNKLQSGMMHEVAEVVKTRLPATLEHFRSLGSMLRSAERATAWNLVVEIINELEMTAMHPLAAMGEVDTLVAIPANVATWENGGTPRERVTLFLKSAKAKRKSAHSTLATKQMDQEDDIFGAHSTEALAALEVGSHTRYSQIQEKVERLSQMPGVMPQQKLQVILTGCLLVPNRSHEANEGDPTMERGEPDVACQLLILSSKTKSSMKSSFVTLCITLRMHLLSYMGYYLAMDSRGRVLSDMMAFAVMQSSMDSFVAGKLQDVPFLFEMERMLTMASGDRMPEQPPHRSTWLSDKTHFADYMKQVPRWLAAVGMRGEKLSHSFTTFMRRIISLLDAIPRSAVEDLEEMLGLCATLVFKVLKQIGQMIRTRLLGPMDQGVVQEEVPDACTVKFDLERLEVAVERGTDMKNGLTGIKRLKEQAEAPQTDRKQRPTANRQFGDRDAELQSMRDRYLAALAKWDPAHAEEVKQAAIPNRKREHDQDGYGNSYKAQRLDGGKGKGKGKGGRGGEKGEGRGKGRGGKGEGKGKGGRGGKGGDPQWGDGGSSLVPGRQAGMIKEDKEAKTWTYPDGHVVLFEKDGVHVDDYTGKCGKVALSQLPFPQALEMCDRCEDAGHSHWDRTAHKYSRDERQKWQQYFAMA